MSRDLRISDAEFGTEHNDCVRCGYHLRGVPDAAACPECGLLAERSRHLDGHLWDATPRWLLGISVGVALILIAHVVAGTWILLTLALLGSRASSYGISILGVQVGVPHVMFVISLVPPFALPVGLWLLTWPQQQTSGDRRLRRWLRVASLAPAASLATMASASLVPPPFQHVGLAIDVAGWLLLTVGCAPIPALTFLMLRRLAERVLHPNLAEHATIVGIGLSATLAALPILCALIWLGGFYGPSYWSTRSETALWIALVGCVALTLFAGWSALNCVRFTLAFARAYRGARRKWREADRSVPPR